MASISMVSVVRVAHIGHREPGRVVAEAGRQRYRTAGESHQVGGGLLGDPVDPRVVDREEPETAQVFDQDGPALCRWPAVETARVRDGRGAR